LADQSARTVLTRERLKETLGDHGQVFETAAIYRRAVDERLFQLTSMRAANAAADHQRRSVRATLLETNRRSSSTARR